MTVAKVRLLALTLMSCAFGIAALALAAGAAASEGPATWRLEQPPPPPAPVGVVGSSTPIGLGSVGDVEFQAPNRGVLITAGNGSTIAPGLWAYNGHEWHQLSIVCGATDGRIAWAGPEELWTISDGRPGQAANPGTGEPAPLADRTLCHIAHGEVVGSYASPAFQVSSYQPMHALGCMSPTDCWFGGDPLPKPENGEAFHLHWDGAGLTAEPNPHGHPAEDMRQFEGRLYESVRLSAGDAESEPEVPFPFALHVINQKGVTPSFESVLGVPLYSGEEFPEALDFLHLGTDGEALWAAAGPAAEPPPLSQPAPVTVLRDAGGQWTQLLGPEATAPGAATIAGDVVTSIAPEPGTGGAWLAVETKEQAEQQSPTTPALIAHVAADGSVETQTLPGAAEVAEGIGPKGAAKQISCPAINDCWMTTTQGWLFHFAPEGERQLALDDSPAFSHLITSRPEDEGLPRIPPDAPPPDDSGELPTQASRGSLQLIPEVEEAKIRAALLSNIHSRLVHGTTLELRFHLTVKARVKLLAKRKQSVVAATPMQTFASGNRKLLLRLNRRKWPTKLDLQTHALAPLPLVSTRLPGNNTVGTRLAHLPGVPAVGSDGSLSALSLAFRDAFG